VFVCAGAGGAGPLAAAAAVRTEWMRGVATVSAREKATPAAGPDRCHPCSPSTNTTYFQLETLDSSVVVVEGSPSWL
jgi:hypothetical protein